MKTPRNLFGRRFADHLISKWNYIEAQQVGSHIVLRSEEPQVGSMSVPAHKPMRVGTLNTLIKLACEQRGVSREEMLRNL